MNQFEQIREQAIQLHDGKEVSPIGESAWGEKSAAFYDGWSAGVVTYREAIRAMPLPEVSQEPAGYFKADQDGNLIWGEDCVCEDPVYPSSDFDTDAAGNPCVSIPFYIVPPDVEALRAEVEKLKAELETERMRLAACGVAALGNTADSVKERISNDNPYYSASYSDVCRAVDAEIALRAASDHHNQVVLELNRLSLVLESAVRYADPGNYGAVMKLIKLNKNVIAKAEGGAA